MTLLLSIFLAAAAQAPATTPATPPAASPAPQRDSVVYADSIVLREAPRVDEQFEGTDILDNMSENVTVNVSEKIQGAAYNQIEQNRASKSDGYRVRIYLDNNRKSREESAAVEQDFKARYPQYNTYRSFKNPFFKVTVGDFRTKSDAKKFLKSITSLYPTAFVVKEKIKFPIIDYSCSVVIDTVKVPVDTIYIDW